MAVGTPPGTSVPRDTAVSLTVSGAGAHSGSQRGQLAGTAASAQIPEAVGLGCRASRVALQRGARHRSARRRILSPGALPCASSPVADRGPPSWRRCVYVERQQDRIDTRIRWGGQPYVVFPSRREWRTNRSGVKRPGVASPNHGRPSPAAGPAARPDHRRGGQAPIGSTRRRSSRGRCCCVAVPRLPPDRGRFRADHGWSPGPSCSGRSGCRAPSRSWRSAARDRQDLGASVESLVWLISRPTIAVALTGTTAGKLGDLHGHRRSVPDRDGGGGGVRRAHRPGVVRAVVDRVPGAGRHHQLPPPGPTRWR